MLYIGANPQIIFKTNPKYTQTKITCSLSYTAESKSKKTAYVFSVHLFTNSTALEDIKCHKIIFVIPTSYKAFINKYKQNKKILDDFFLFERECDRKKFLEVEKLLEGGRSIDYLQ